jgi:hypothetical protein
MSSRVDRGTANGSLYQEGKNQTAQGDELAVRKFGPLTLTGTAGQDRSDVPLNPITVYLLWPQSSTRAHFAGAYRFSMRHEVIVKQKASIPVANKRGRPCNSSSI